MVSHEQATCPVVLVKQLVNIYNYGLHNDICKQCYTYFIKQCYFATIEIYVVIEIIAGT